jgi:hypothetical protein
MGRRKRGVFRRPVGAPLVCPAWALDWRCKSSVERVGSNHEPKATACRAGVVRRRLWGREAVWGRSWLANRSTERK